MPAWGKVGLITPRHRVTASHRVTIGASSRRLATAATVLCGLALSPSAQTGPSGMRDPAWAPDGKRLAVVILDRIWTTSADGRDGRELTRLAASEREPAWSADGKRIAFVADPGEGFDLFVVDARGGAPERVLHLDGDERSPSWTPDGRIVFAHRAPEELQWDLFVVDPSGAAGNRVAQRLTQSPDDELHPRVSPDGRRLAFTSNRNSDDGDFDIWMMRLFDRTSGGSSPGRGPAVRLARQSGYDGFAEWSPDGARLAFYSARDGVGSTWVTAVNALTEGDALSAGQPLSPAVLVSRHGGTLTWSPDGRLLAIGEIPEPDPGYNGNPRRDLEDPPALFSDGRAYRLWIVPAPRAVDDGARALAAPSSLPTAPYKRAFETVWTTLRRVYYQSGESARAWDRLRVELEPRAEQARSESAFEEVIDQMIARQPLVKPRVTSSRAVVVSAHPLASEAGRAVLARGGNVVDAAIAVSFVLGVVEPDASGIGGDGQAVLFLNGMPEPSVIDFKDQTPGAATIDNPRIFRGARLVGDGPLASNIPGVVAGLDYLHKKYGGGRISWSELIAPAIAYAEQGFVLDQTLPSSIAEGRQYFQKYAASARIYLPNGRVPKVGERFVNRDYAATLRTIASEGAESFYRGSLARRIAADMQANDGLITYDDLAQYQAIERKPIKANYRDHVLFTGGPPVGAGVSLLEAFQVLGHYKPRANASSAADPDYWHYQIESWKMRDRVARIADPAQWPVDFEEHLGGGHAAGLFDRINPRVAQVFPEDSDEIGGGPERIGSGTSGFVVADVEGNVIAVTQTLSTWGGSFYVSRGLGFLYNNHLRSNRTAQGAYGHLKPLTRSNTANVPIVAFRERGGARAPRLAVASAGNAWIPASTYSIVTSVIDGGMSMQQAIEAPRFLVTRDPSDFSGRGARVEIEDRFPRSVIQDLAARGHRFRKIGRKGELRYGFASGVLIDGEHGQVEGGADPRRSHAASALDVGSTSSQQF
jgi:gamma-glutamyltranspeptidase